ncbi:MAG: hypothetical protein DYG87_07415 [Anaerolineae bacterium CFX3]|jgi:hypothetical protein|nr:hypothetical protein [Anaerolineales bacterium]MCC7511860.1 hypothetical protein [Anaerolineae bacterium]MCE7905609.1 hypothetical protein [Anaerolineae bacterium CFX3]OQY80345.1 MAG: hypothetical protein B6D40_13100 [Anaerolineae bacterium UTCFX3]GER78460.1 conserved hypothetical protein [Candidatus Denitrolinea symbiosum]
MNTDGILVAALVIGIVVLANGLMFLWARSWARGDNATRDFLKGAQNAIGKPFEKQNRELDELHRRVDDLKK